jgi:hypothetical protein
MPQVLDVGASRCTAAFYVAHRQSVKKSEDRFAGTRANSYYRAATQKSET